MAISRAQLLKELLPGLNALFGLEYEKYENEHAEIYETENSERSFEEEVKLSGFGAAPVKPEGSAIAFDSAQESFTARYNHETIGMGFSVTEEAMEDNLYDALSARYTKALARAMAYTKQVKAANLLNNGFTTFNSGEYVTSSHCTTAAALLNGVPPQAIRNVWGVAKIYETYVGAKRFQPDDNVFNTIQQVGEEYGATTGRVRQCNWMNVDTLKKAIRMNGVTDLVFNKMDVLQNIGEWKFYSNNKLMEFENEDQVKSWITSHMSFSSPQLNNIYFSGDKDRI